MQNTIGKPGKVRIGCTCDAERTEDCKCVGVTKIDISGWEYLPATDIGGESTFEDFDPVDSKPNTD